MPNQKKSTPDDPFDGIDVDALLDDPTLKRDWRYRATGYTQAQALALVPRHRAVRFEAPEAVYADLARRARAADCSMAAWVRRAIHSQLCLDPDIDPDVLRWWGDG